MTSERASGGKLVVFFTRGMSLGAWQAAGILERELALFLALRPDVRGLAFLTYGGASELEWEARLPGIEILPNRWGLGANLYSVLAPWLHRASLRDAAVFRTHQINGAWTALIARLLFGRALIARCGYLWSDGVARMGASRWRRMAARAMERLVMRSADRVVVAGEADAATVVDRYRLPPGRVWVIPNFVDTDRFCPEPVARREAGRIAFVGRLEVEKNVEALIDAVARVPGASLTIAGDGSRRAALEARARALGVRAEFLGRVPHHDLPALLNRAGLFVMPSFYEGNPKAILEAMACGLPVVASRVSGIREIVAHGETGLLCGTSADDIRSAVMEVLRDEPLSARLSQGGLRYVRERCSLTATVDRERSLLASLGPSPA